MELFKLVATDGAILAGGFSEPQSGGTGGTSQHRHPAAGGGYRLSGTKTFFTGWPRATHLFLTAVVETDGDRADRFLVPWPSGGAGAGATGRRWACGPPAATPWPSTTWRSRLSTWSARASVAVSFLVGSHWSGRRSPASSSVPPRSSPARGRGPAQAAQRGPRGVPGRAAGGAAGGGGDAHAPGRGPGDPAGRRGPAA